MQTHAEHQQNDAEVGEFACEPLVGDKTGRERPDDHAGKQVSDEGRHLDTLQEHAKDESEHKPDDDRGYQRRLMRHSFSLALGHLVAAGAGPRNSG